MANIILHKDEHAVRRLLLLREARNYYQHNLANLRKRGMRYVILHGTDHVAEGDESELLWNQAAKKKIPLSECLLVHIPQEGENYFF